MKFSTLEDLSKELHICPGTARNRLALGQDRPPSIRIGRRRLFPVSEFKQWVERIIAPLQEAPRKDAVSLQKSGGPGRIDKADNLP
ncbi:MAG: DNA-binding protein [Betaproteobacteria bacterium]|nr:DNA-binding protein [Betaproteobacteria bacterium]